ncbi:uncharacterized protein LOC143289753 [Babylonia areolata]|uniref:uncharacterized protein LOC143289753 n=1 Tax=Babylonia areolata TaxID=304850 RepID=UPI003FD51ABC
MTSIGMTSLMTTWVTLCLCLLYVTEGKKREKGGWSEALPFLQTSERQGLFAMVQNLVRQVTDMNAKHARDWSRLRRVERRGKSSRHDIDVMHADIIQLRQHVIEINSRLDRLDDLTSDLKLEVTKVNLNQENLKEEAEKARQSRHKVKDSVERVRNNVTEIESWTSSAQARLERLQGWTQELQKGQHELLAALSILQASTRSTSPSPHPPRSQSPRRSSFGSVEPNSADSLSLKEEVGTEEEQQQQQRRLSASSPEQLKELKTFQNRPQGDQSPSKGDQDAARHQESTRGQDSVRHRDSIRDQGPMTTPSLHEDDHSDVNTSGDGEMEQDGGSGDDEEEGGEFFILEEEVTEHAEREEGEKRAGGGRGGGTTTTTDNIQTKAAAVTPLPLTTNTAPTLTHPSLTLPTSPIPLCPSLAEFFLLQRRVEDLDRRLKNEKNSMPAEDVLNLLKNRTERLEAALTERDGRLERVQSEMGDLGVSLSRLAGQVASFRLGELMDRVQTSWVNFSAGVVTLDQWELVNRQMVNTTERTQRRLTELGRRVADNAQVTSDLQMTLEEQRAMSERQYRVLQTHVIRLNNSLQDVREGMDAVSSRKSYSDRPAHGRQLSGPSSKRSQQGAVLMSRVDDLALQLVYSDNRLSRLETQLLNSSLSACRKSNSDLYQDASLLRVDQHLSEAQRDLVTLKDTVKRLDLGLYRLHGNSKATQEALRKVKGQVNDAVHVAGKVEALRTEVDNLLFQTPSDCEDYYQRGYRQSGEYVIYPRGAAHSLKVRCIMQLRDDDDNGEEEERRRRKGEKDGHGKGKRGRSGWMEEGGWTVIHQRSSGKVNFTRSWADYAMGFGTPRSEYWLGNEYLHLLTHHRNYTLLISLTDVYGGRWRATYRPFALSGKEDNFRLHLGRYQGNATDTLRYASGMTFSTYDRDTDVSSSPCARYNGGGWWYSHCQTSNLNGPYDVGMIWFHKDWKDWLQLRQAAMMIRPLT